MKQLHNWFLKNQREFPWRVERTPYKVWISEIMLQQTRANVVIPYFERWMGLFPNVRALAAAPLERVIKAWEGLGYYSRARNLHAGAQQIVERFGGEIPSKREDLETIRGLGPYTIGAVLSFGFQERAPAVDGNVTRVVARYFLIEENVCKGATKKKIEEKAEALLDREEPWVTAEALIELGATICTPRPRCADCPIQEGCKAFHSNKAEVLPIKNAEKEITELHRTVLLVVFQDKILVRKGKRGQVMADLYEFPYFEGRKREKLGLKGEWMGEFPVVSHSFTRYKAYLYPHLLRASNFKEVVGYEWISIAELDQLPFSSGHRRILKEFRECESFI
ncbi:MAG TPA: A/G-specific adenine glycosylase [Chlamydiales bacterium]|nr:A/G-specific adenine glycosylase [Chlamydiales bacterium]